MFMTARPHASDVDISAFRLDLKEDAVVGMSRCLLCADPFDSLCSCWVCNGHRQTPEGGEISQNLHSLWDVPRRLVGVDVPEVHIAALRILHLLPLKHVGVSNNVVFISVLARTVKFFTPPLLNIQEFLGLRPSCTCISLFGQSLLELIAHSIQLLLLVIQSFQELPLCLPQWPSRQSRELRTVSLARAPLSWAFGLLLHA
mmetsp:Transcript_21721/g.71856  ORF Transcript_21721/g.71856 Transcript_21721/m.71856 type:complete len:201 (-) Transcript_21721:233-835(-)